MKKTVFPLVIIMFSVLLSVIQVRGAIEGMSPEEYALREEHDNVRKRLYECFALNNVDPRNIPDYVCREEQDEMKLSAEKFNNFMREKEARRPSLEVARQQLKEFEEKYRESTVEELLHLHKEYCQTKWGSAATPECTAIGFITQSKQLEHSQ